MNQASDFTMIPALPRRGLRGYAHWTRFFPVVVLLVVIVFEGLTLDYRVSPSALTIGLAVLSLMLPPRQILLWAAVFFVPVLGTLLLIPNAGVPEQLPVVILRSVAYIVVVIMAFGVSRYRQRSERQIRSLALLFDSLRTPIVVSDHDGNITFANRACCELLGCSLQEAKDSTFFSLFSHPDHRGKSIEAYLGYFEGAPQGSMDMVLSVRGTGKNVKAVGSVLEIDGSRLLVSQLV